VKARLELAVRPRENIPMKRYRLPEGTTPGDIPTSILEHQDPPLTNTYMALHALASLMDDWGPFTPAQLLERVPPPPNGAPASLADLERDLRLLAELGYIQVEYLA
jgi:hypothetical protein